MARPKEFDTTDVLSKAMHVFWQHGYEGTSIQDVVDHVGIKAQSLYNTFGGKRELFFAALRHYASQKTLIEILEKTPSGKAAITKVFQDIVTTSSEADRKKGCFMINTCVELAPHDPEIAKFIEKESASVEHAYYDALIRAKGQGELHERHQDLMALARFLNSAHGGLIVTAKTVSDMKALEDIVRVTLSILD
ncbi:TetR/AcrR family transcriptional regulator [Paenibacillus enshidis]|uniref:TetR/AcrR family transcriptional regulator n=1 Tax=Paenibacillus enshidis TaxID=1458439 RepID=A0ABV5API1_9BACL